MASIVKVCCRLSKFNTLYNCSNVACVSSSAKCFPDKSFAIINFMQTRNTSFFTKISGEQLWASVTGVSNAGQKKGRGKRVGRKKNTDLNRGQRIGTGKANIKWPGLNTNVLQKKEVVKMSKLPPDPDYEANIIKKREELSRISHRGKPSLLRGWTGNYQKGTDIGPPDPISDYKFEGFESRVLDFRLVTNMTGTLGRKQRFTCFVVVGNKNGIAGFGHARANMGMAAMKQAKNRAAQQLVEIPMFEDHTVYHNMFAKFHRTKVFIHKKEKGYGIRAHRVLKTIAEVIGIKDLHCKVEGSTKNTIALTKAFFNALKQQESHVDLAERMGLHVVEFRKERDYLPVVVASPSGEVKTKQLTNEIEDIDMDYDRLYYGGKHEYEPAKPLPFYYHYPGARRKRKILNRRRGQHQAQVLRKAGLW